MMNKINIRKYQVGVSLIEILIVVLILGVGLLGLATLQAVSLSSNQEAYFHSQASSIAEDLSSRIRSSKRAVIEDRTFTLTHDVFIANYAQAGVYTCNAKPKMCGTYDGTTGKSDCDTIGDIAAFDKWDICTIANNAIPEGKVRVLTSQRRLSIVVEWLPIKARSDVGQKANLNPSCKAILGEVVAEKNCIITEIVP